jgi:DNA-binding NarL/FixJ family response regulator
VDAARFRIDAPMIRVCLIEDQTLVREGLESLIHHTTDIRVVSLAKDGAEALDRVARSDPDILLVDLRMPGMDGLTFLKTLNAKPKSAMPSTILTTFDEDAFVLEGLRPGAKGYLCHSPSSLKQSEQWLPAVGQQAPW